MIVDVLLGVFFFAAIICVVCVPWMMGDHASD